MSRVWQGDGDKKKAAKYKREREGRHHEVKAAPAASVPSLSPRVMGFIQGAVVKYPHKGTGRRCATGRLR